MKKIILPLNDNEIKDLTAGDSILLSGTLYIARDAAHKKLCEMIRSGCPLPLNPEGAFFYYAGPCPAKPGQIIGSCGPTTSYRMDAYAPLLYEHGAKGAIGKGLIGDNVIESMKKNTCVYLVATGGCGALISKCIKKAEIIAFNDLGAEALRKIEVSDMPLTVGIDSFGNSIL